MPPKQQYATASKHFEESVESGKFDPIIDRYKFRDKRQKDRYLNNIRKQCVALSSKNSKQALNRLLSEYHSSRKELVAETICEFFRITRNELATGELAPKPKIARTPGWERLQRRGFEDGAHVPHSQIRKIDK